MPMDPISWAVLGLSAANMFRGMAKEKASRSRAATAMEWSPWTGMQPEQVQEANPFGDLANGAVTYAMMNQNAADAEWKKNMSERQVSAFEKMAGVGNTAQKGAQAALPQASPMLGGSSWVRMIGTPNSTQDLPPWGGATDDEIRRWQMQRY